jgi:hypothetical protein
VFEIRPETKPVHCIPFELGTLRSAICSDMCARIPNSLMCCSTANIVSPDLYHLAFPTDNRVHKWLVYSVHFLETVDIVFLTYDALADFRDVFGLSAPVSSRNTSLPVQFSWLRMYIFGGIGMFASPQTTHLIRVRFPLSDLHGSVLPCL